jgi:hypothetical protein
LITTDNAVKWLKFGVSYDYWCEKVYENNCMFGIVKTAHESKLGSVQKMSYQMVNSLDVDIMKDVVQKSVDYVTQLKTNDDVFLEYLKMNSNFSNDYEVLVALCEHNPDFVRSKYFRKRKETIIKNYILNLKSGKILQNADNLTLIGSPYAMLLYAATGNEEIVDTDDTFCFEQDTVQCYTERFADKEYLALFRSPFNGKYNLVYAHNVYDERFKKYFNFGKQIIAVNMIGTDVQDRANGCDMDSDFSFKVMFAMAVATSIDALAVGISFAFLKMNIWTSILIIGVTTAAFSGAGICIGNLFGCRYKSKAEFAGGAILVIIGLKILIEHLLA